MSFTELSGELSRSISNGIVKHVAEYTGRGPRRANTTIAGDWVFVTLEDTLTKGERQLAANGHWQAVLDTRESYQRMMRGDLEAVIRSHLGREVIAFMSDNHIDPDVAIEAFLLAPSGGNGWDSTGR